VLREERKENFKSLFIFEVLNGQVKPDYEPQNDFEKVVN